MQPISSVKRFDRHPEMQPLSIFRQNKRHSNARSTPYGMSVSESINQIDQIFFRDLAQIIRNVEVF